MTQDCADRYGRGTREVQLCVYLITHPVDDTARDMYLGVKNGPICDQLHPSFQIPPRPSQAWLDCVHNGPGDGLDVKILQYATPFVTVAGSAINAAAEKLHVDPSVAAIILGAGLAFTLAALPEIALICAEVCTIAAATAEAMTPLLAPELVPLVMDGLFLSFYGPPTAAIAVEVGALLGSIRAMMFVEREFVAAKAAEAELAALMRALKACGGPSGLRSARVVVQQLPNECAFAIRAVTSVDDLAALWKLPDQLAIERVLGGNLPEGFEYIDIWNAATKTGTSIKTIDVRAMTYSISNSAITSTGKKYVDDLVNFRRNGAFRGTPVIPPGDIQNCVLYLAYPESATASQIAALQRVVAYGILNRVTVYLFPIRG